MTTSNVKGLFTIQWIVSPRFDLFFFIGSCVFTFLFYGIYQFCIYMGLEVNGYSILVTYFLFTAFFDHPHIFQTFSRTHADKTEFQNRKYLYTLGILAFVLAGLVATGMGYIKELIIFAAVFGSWHVIKQHYGFLIAYKKINGDDSKLDNLIDIGTFYMGMFACFFNNYSGGGKPLLVYGDLFVKFPVLPDETGEFIWKIFYGFLLTFFVRQIHRMIENKPINLPKILFMSCAIFTHYFVFFATETAFLVAEALETAYHAVQYHGWMAHYQKKTFPQVKSVALKWLTASMLYGLVVGVIEIYGLLDHQWAIWIFVPFSMLVLFHYYVDGLIWKFGSEPALGQLLFKKDN